MFDRGSRRLIGMVLGVCASCVVALGVTTDMAFAQPPAQEAQRSWGLVETNGTKLYYDEAGTGSPVILIHGGWLNSRQWDEQMTVLSRHYRVIRYDCRGSGRSPLGDSTYAHDDDLAALFTQLHIERAQIIGLSAGAQVAIDFTLSHQASVASLMIGSSPLGGFDTGPEFQDGMRGVIGAGVADDLELLHQRIWAFAPFRVASGMPGVRNRLDAMILHDNTWAANRPNAPKAKRPPTPPAARLAEIKVPILVVIGTGEMTGLVKEGEFVAQNIPGAEIVRVENAGHFANLEQPTQFDDIALEWLGRVRR
jgi:pimeloyl-ACP methyl ester carboxylesterase